VIVLILAALCGAIYWQSRKTKVDHQNVNAEWTGTVVPAEPATEKAAA
jgi:inorganic phosphate transporter, PiT family